MTSRNFCTPLILFVTSFNNTTSFKYDHIAEKKFANRICGKVVDHINPGMHNSNQMAGQIFFVVMFKGQNLLTCFIVFKGCFQGISKLNQQNCGLCGPEKKPPRATFLPASRMLCMPALSER